MSSCLGDSDSSISPQKSFAYINEQWIAQTAEMIYIDLDNTEAANTLTREDCAILSYKQKNWIQGGQVNKPEYVQVVTKFSSSFINNYVYVDETALPAYNPGTSTIDGQFYPTSFSLAIGTGFQPREEYFKDRGLFSFSAKQEDLVQNVKVYFVYDPTKQTETKKDDLGNDYPAPIADKNQAIIDVYFVNDPTGFSVSSGATSANFVGNLSDFRNLFRASTRYQEVSDFYGITPVTFKFRYTRLDTKASPETKVETYLGSWDYADGFYLAYVNSSSTGG
ncbi:hypothetical protein [Dysgonomonas sp. 25]|uniref:hypothetical protein n=1 Tax=Dysgonomonas sp. 25 TaxID=2302933 RepID=UPI0013D2B060|nr:hypothetical protein [Dysgonomonas sp. 25]